MLPEVSTYKQITIQQIENVRSVGGLEILVESVALGDELLLPLSEAALLNLDLLSEPLAQVLFLLLELGVVQFAGSGLAKLAGLHLLGTVGFVVGLLGSVDEIQHVGADQDRTELLEITVVLILNLSNTPGILATLDDTTIVGLDILLGTNDGERHSSHQAAGVGSGVLIILLNWRGVDLDALGLDNGANLVVLLVHGVPLSGQAPLIVSDSLVPCTWPGRRG